MVRNFSEVDQSPIPDGLCKNFISVGGGDNSSNSCFVHSVMDDVVSIFSLGDCPPESIVECESLAIGLNSIPDRLAVSDVFRHNICAHAVQL